LLKVPVVVWKRGRKEKMTEKKEILDEKIRKQAEEDRKKRNNIRKSCLKARSCNYDCLRCKNKG